MKPSGIIGVAGAIIGLAALAMVVARPGVVTAFFAGSSQLLGTAIGPVTGYTPNQAARRAR